VLKKLWIVPLLLCLAHSPARSEVVDRIIATVNGEVITLSDFYMTAAIFLQLNQVPSAAMASDDGRQRIANRILQELVNRELLDQQAEQHSLQVETSAVDDYITLISQQTGSTVDQLRERLEDEGIAYGDFHEYIRFELTKLRVVNVMVTSGITVSDAEVDALFREHYPESAAEIHYDLSQIVIQPPRGGTDEAIEAARATAEEIRGRAVAGEDFAELAQAHSDDATRRDGGHMGSFRQGQLPAAFEGQILGLSSGAISEVFQTRFGFHIVRMNDRWEESSIDVDAAREEIYREIQLSKQNREVERYMAQLHDESIVQILFEPAELY
jgi:parvulin-like peptidyl-prolyl isomerase